MVQQSIPEDIRAVAPQTQAVARPNKGSIVFQLIMKDFRLHRTQILVSIGAGAVALAVFQAGSEPAAVVGSVFFFIALILVSAMLPIAGIVNERKKQNLAFLISLPVSSIQYTTSKLISTLVMFSIPWLTLVTAAALLIESRRGIPHGTIPLLFILALLPFIGCCLMIFAALVGESEGWGIAANVFCSSTYGLTWYFISRIPEVMKYAPGPVPVWNSTVLSILGCEVGICILLLGLTYFFQSRKRDFI
jgi:hypothetical protein